MKFSADKLKSIDYKKLALNHVEKAIAGLFALVIVLILFMPLFAGKFSGYDKTPEELTKQASDTHDDILKSEWPDDEINKYQGIADLELRISSIIKPDLPVYRSIEIAPPLYRKKEARKEPDWLKIDNLVLVSDRGQFEIPPELELEGVSPEGSNGILPDGDGGIGIPLGQQDDQNKIPAKFRRKSGSRGGGSGVGAVSGANFDLGGGEDAAGEDDMDDASDDGMDGEFDEDGGFGGGGGPIVEGRGYRYTLVTGVFNIRTQRDRIVEALSILNSQSMQLELLGFEVARIEGTGPWPEVEDHQILDINKSMQVLMEMAGFDFDPVEHAVKHQQITSPLPLRIYGEWGDEVAHPKISNYVLNTDEGKELDEYLTTYLAELQDKDNKLRDLVEKNRNFGFGSIQRNMRGLAIKVFGGRNNQSGRQSFSQGYQSAYGGGNQGSQRGRGARTSTTQQTLITSAVDRISAAGTLLLFRYFDFDIEPGKTYQYRVRLIFKNPNFNVPVSELEDEDSRLGETRKTPWSDLTRPVTVLKDTEYFLAKVSVPVGKKNEASSLLLFQWKPAIGTVISNLLDSLMGQYIGGEKMTDVLRPDLQTFELEKTEFTSDDLLVDSNRGVDVNYRDHTDLNLPKRLTVAGKGRLRIMDEALVQDVSGRLFSIDPFSTSTEKQNARQRFNWQNQPWQFLKDNSGDGGMGDGLDGAEDGEDGMEEDGGGANNSRGGRRGRARRKNKLKKNSGGGGY
jgi:hypothetical protein